MSKLIKKISAIVLTAVMVLIMCFTVSAEGSDTPAVNYPTAADTAAITATNIEAGADVNVYRVVEPVYIDGIGFKEYRTVPGVSISDPVAPTASEITAIAKGIADGTITGLTAISLNASQSAPTTYTAAAGAGYWVILVTGAPAAGKVYNPMLAGVYYSVDASTKTLTQGLVDADSDWSINGTDTYEKSVDVSVEKVITNSAAEKTDGSVSDKGDDLAIGDYASFQVTGTIPAYTQAYTQVTYKITDTLSTGLKAEDTTAHPIKIKVNNADVIPGADTCTLTLSENGRSIVVDFNSAYALAHKGETVVLTYDAQLTDSAATNFDPNTNTVKVTYSNTPVIGEDGKTPVTDTPEKKTYHYTFEIDGKLFGTAEEEWNKTTTELTKTGKNEEKTETWSLLTDNGPLAGAEFTLTRTDKTKADGSKYTYTAASDTNGVLNFKGLDAGTYNLQETKAPKGYSLNSTVYPVVISAQYNEDGTLNNYSININGTDGKTFTYTAAYENKIVHNITADTTIGTDTFEIRNTPLSGLPSTGGTGIYIFTVTGVLLMVCAAGAFMVNRRKSEN